MIKDEYITQIGVAISIVFSNMLWAAAARPICPLTEFVHSTFWVGQNYVVLQGSN